MIIRLRFYYVTSSDTNIHASKSIQSKLVYNDYQWDRKIMAVVEGEREE
jgi:hypothetical protein